MHDPDTANIRHRPKWFVEIPTTVYIFTIVGSVFVCALVPTNCAID
jgi:hypothetical protein